MDDGVVGLGQSAKEKAGHGGELRQKLGTEEIPQRREGGRFGAVAFNFWRSRTHL